MSIWLKSGKANDQIYVHCFLREVSAGSGKGLFCLLGSSERGTVD